MSGSDYHIAQHNKKPADGQDAVDVDTENPSFSQFEVDDVSLPLLPLAVRQDEPAEGPSAGPATNGDETWAHVFTINVLVTVITAMFLGKTAIEVLASDGMSFLQPHRLQPGNSGDAGEGEDGHALFNIFVGGAVLIAIAALVTVSLLHVIFRCGRHMLISSYTVFAMLLGVHTVVAITIHPIAAFIPALLCAVVVCVIRRRKHRIAFSAANLKVAALAIKTMPWTIYSSLLMAVVQFCWSAVVAIATLGSYAALETVSVPDGTSYRAVDCTSSKYQSCTCNGEKISDEECHRSGLGLPLMIFWLLSLAWGCGVIKNVVACTVTGSVASWWFTPNEDPAPVKGAFYRATHFSFGSLCKAAVVQGGMAVLRMIPCASIIMSWASVAVRYILSYTIAFVGVYGLGFNDAGRRVRELFDKRGVIPLANDIVVEFGLGLLGISMTLVYAAMSMALLFTFSHFEEDGALSEADEAKSHPLEFWSLVGPQVFGAVTCMLLLSTVLEVVLSGFKAVFVCFVQDPEALAQKHDPELHEELSAAWRKMQTENLGNGTVTNGTVVDHAADSDTPAATS